MSYILPKRLEKGDTVGVIAPSGPITDKGPLLKAKNFFEENGYKVIFSENIFSQDRYLSSSDELRLKDLHWAFTNTEIDTIICARGGYGALRLINDIDYELIKNNPKNFCGYSDITILSAMMLKKANIITYSSPMMKGDFGTDIRDEYTIRSFFNALTHKEQILKANTVHNKGITEGIIWGGNLASIVSLCGTDFIPDEDFIFFTEDLNEPVYKIDKMLTQLLNIGKFRKHVKGIAFGQFLDNGYPEQLKYLFDEIAKELNIPTASGFLISHDDKKATIPYGKECLLEDNTLKI